MFLVPAQDSPLTRGDILDECPLVGLSAVAPIIDHSVPRVVLEGKPALKGRAYTCKSPVEPGCHRRFALASAALTRLGRL